MRSTIWELFSHRVCKGRGMQCPLKKYSLEYTNGFV